MERERVRNAYILGRQELLCRLYNLERAIQGEGRHPPKKECAWLAKRWARYSEACTQWKCNLQAASNGPDSV